MMKWLLPFFLLSTIANAQTANVNPVPGDIWTYFGPTLGDGWSGNPSAPAISDNTTLALTQTTIYPGGVWRTDYAAGNGAPPLFFTPQIGTCAANSLVNDGGSCVDGAGGNSWKAIQSADGFDARQFGVKADGVQRTSGAINSGSAVFTSSVSAFTSADVGKFIAVSGAGAAGATLVTTIAGYSSPTQVTLANAAGTTVGPSAGWAFGTDNTAALTKAIAAAGSQNPLNSANTLRLPSGGLLITGPQTLASQIRIVGRGRAASTIALKGGSASPLFSVQTAGSNFSASGYPTGQIIFDNLTLTSMLGKSDPAGAGVAHGISITNGTWTVAVEFNNSTVYAMPGDGIHGATFTVGWLDVNNSKIINNNGTGLYGSGVADWRIIGGIIGTNTTDNINLINAVTVEFHGTRSFSSGGTGLTASGTTNVAWFGGQINSNGKDGVLLGAPSGSDAAKFVGVDIGANGTSVAATYYDIEIATGTTIPPIINDCYFTAPTNVIANLGFTGTSTAQVDVARNRIGLGSPYAAGFTNSLENLYYPPGDPEADLILNGAFSLDQPNEGATYNTANAAVMDGWKSVSGNLNAATFTIARAASGLKNAAQNMLFTTFANSAVVAGRFAILDAQIEASRLKALGWGTASAQSVVLSFRAKASQAGDYTVNLANAANNRAYAATYTLASNVDTFVVIVIPGDTTGTWPSTGGALGASVTFWLSAGSSQQTSTLNAWRAGGTRAATTQVDVLATLNATLALSNVRLEPGTVASAYAPRSPSSLLLLAQRYFVKTFPQGTAAAQNAGLAGARCAAAASATAGTWGVMWGFPVPMAASPTIITYNPSAANANIRDVTGASDAVVNVDPAAAKGTTGVMIGEQTTALTAGHNLCIHATADARL